MDRRRVVITGMGAVTPIGNNVRETWRGLLEGRSGIGKISIFDASGFPTQIAGEIKGFDFSKWPEKDESLCLLGRNSHFALEAASEAMKDSGVENARIPKNRIGVYFGAGDGGFDFSEYASIISESLNGGSSVKMKDYRDKSLKRLTPKSVLEQEPYQTVNHLARVFQAQGTVSNCLTACAASSQAIGEAAEIIRRGDADVMITGGTHSMIHPLGVAGFNLLTALSVRNDDPARASRPFDKGRDGFVLSEGSGVIILEELERAKKRGAKIYAEFAGYGATADAFRLTDPHPDGKGAVQAMRLSLEDALVSIDGIDYINAHGTSTELNDFIETSSVKQVFKDHAYRIPMSSIKSMLGHMIAAAGVVELIASILTIREGIIPPTINYETPDDACDLDYVPNNARETRVKNVLSNSFGFGGQNIALVVKKFEG
ncbi:MAG: beta-ketoacyl-[acyl-carrier-protein] synthase II [Omnitrophica bacterium RIFCSPHIGHO2_02_FULL_51_18]|nr:MAG: beta-ketoacyl-[acyl-carrier-protein] synthase II [Omnitrophica bacterium RIFCSPHIGHO2_02_FULL_51_18]